MRVSVVYPGLEENVRKEADIDAEEKHDWKLSKRLMIKPDHGRKVGGWRLVALRFELIKADEGADARIDDVLVDPRTALLRSPGASARAARAEAARATGKVARGVADVR